LAFLNKPGNPSLKTIFWDNVDCRYAAANFGGFRALRPSLLKAGCRQNWPPHTGKGLKLQLQGKLDLT
jgi:hypothetical protein